MRRTFHLVPADVWAGHALGANYEAPTLTTEGFIHCTDGADELMATANRYYRDDPRTYVALTIDLDLVGSPWTIEDASGIYPHVHGAIPAASIIDVRQVLRDREGRFIRLESLTLDGQVPKGADDHRAKADQQQGRERQEADRQRAHRR